MRAEPQIVADLDLSIPSLEALSFLLRHKEMWPRDFAWNYAGCSSCAMGLAHQLWEEMMAPDSLEMSRVFDMPLSRSIQIFGGTNLCAAYEVLDYGEVTPEMVADKIDQYLASV